MTKKILDLNPPSNDASGGQGGSFLPKVGGAGFQVKVVE
jgi:hypothetical protein